MERAKEGGFSRRDFLRSLVVGALGTGVFITGSEAATPVLEASIESDSTLPTSSKYSDKGFQRGLDYFAIHQEKKDWDKVTLEELKDFFASDETLAPFAEGLDERDLDLVRIIIRYKAWMSVLAC